MPSFQFHIHGYAKVPRNHPLPVGRLTTARADHLVARAPAEVWKRCSASNGARDRDCMTGLWPRCHPRRAHPLRAGPPTAGPLPDHRARHRAGTGLLPVLRPDPTPDEDLIRVASARWAIEGVSRPPDRRRPGPLPGPPLRRLIPLHHLGHARPRLPRRDRRDHPKSPSHDLIPLTLGEVRRLLTRLTHTVVDWRRVRAWSRWWRRHQHRAKTSHSRKHHQHHNWEGRRLARWRLVSCRSGRFYLGFPAIAFASTMAGAPFPASARQTVHAVLPHTAYRRSSPAAFDFLGPERSGWDGDPIEADQAQVIHRQQDLGHAHPQARRRLPRLDSHSASRLGA